MLKHDIFLHESNWRGFPNFFYFIKVEIIHCVVHWNIDPSFAKILLSFFLSFLFISLPLFSPQHYVFFISSISLFLACFPLALSLLSSRSRLALVPLSLGILGLRLLHLKCYYHLLMKGKLWREPHFVLYLFHLFFQ